MSSKLDTSIKPREIFNKEDSELLATAAFNFVIKHFDSGKDPNGKAWAPYTKRYQRRLKALGEPTKIDMIRTGKLRANLKKRAARRKFVVGITGKLAKDKGYITAHSERPFIGLSMEECEKLINMWIKNMTERWNKALVRDMDVKEAAPISQANDLKAAPGGIRESEAILQEGTEIIGDADI